eukprot:s4889_g3.t1
MAVSTFVEQQKADLEEKTYKAVKATQLKQLLDDIAVFSGLTAENATQVTAILGQVRVFAAAEEDGEGSGQEVPQDDLVAEPVPCHSRGQDLPDAVRAEAYQPDDPAVVVEGSIVKATIMRKSSAELRTQDALMVVPNNKKARTSFGQNREQQTQQEMFAGMANQFASFMMSYMGGGSNREQQTQQEMFAGMANQFASFMMSYMGGGSAGSSGSAGPDLPGFRLLQPPKGQGKQSFGETMDQQTDSQQQSSPPPQQSLATQRPTLQSATQQQASETKAANTLQFQLPDTSPPNEERALDRQPLSAEEAAEAIEKAVENRAEETGKQKMAGILKKPAAAAGSTAKAKAKSSAKAKAKSQVKKTSVTAGPNKGWVVEVLYFSLKQFGGLALSKEDSWFVLTAVRSIDVKRLSNGMTQLMKRHSFLSASHWPSAVGDKGASAKKVIPKAHLNMHLGDLLRRHGVLLSCFVRERRHKEIKRYANNLDSMQAGSEKHILQLELEEHLKNLLVFSERKAGLLNPKPAADLVQSAFCDFFSLPCCPGLLVSMSCHVGSGRLCKREDVVVIRGTNGDEVAQVWFHVEFNGNRYTCLSEWLSLGRNRFQTNEEPVFRSTDAICRLCVFKKEGDRALVIPLSMPM